MSISIERRARGFAGIRGLGVAGGVVGRRSPLWLLGLALAVAPQVCRAVGGYASQGSEYAVVATGLGEQVYPDVAVRPGGGIVVYQDNATDGSGLGISFQVLDSGLSPKSGAQRVNQVGAEDQRRPRVALLNDGGAVITWQGGKQGYQNIYARFLSPTNTWVTGDILVNSSTNGSRVNPVAKVLKGGNVVISWGSFNQEGVGSLQGVYGQMFSPTGAKIGGEFRINQTTAYNQRAPAIAPLSDGRFAVVWVSEQQRFENSVDVFARIYSAAGAAVTGELLVNTSTNVTAYPDAAGGADGSFLVTWSERDPRVRSNGWDIVSRPISTSGTGGVVRRINNQTFGDQIAPRVGFSGSDYLVIWTSVGQDGSREGVFGRYLDQSGVTAESEFRINTTTVSQQMHPAVGSDGVGRFLVVWSGFVGGDNSFDLQAQRYASTTQPLAAPDAPYVTVLSSNALAVSWPAQVGMEVARFEVFADGAPEAGGTTTNNYWNVTGLAPSSTHYFQVAYVLADGRRSPLSPPTTNSTYGALWYFNAIPQEWMIGHFGSSFWTWPAPNSDVDQDGATLLQEFQAGTNPTDVNSVLRTRLRKTDQGMYLNWNTQPGLLYQVQASGDLGQWSNVGGMRFAAGYLDSMYLGLGSQGYYRVLRVR